jgi:outer membrane biosynthesis protein TonB
MEFRSATAISAGLHAAVLLWAVVSFSGHRLEATPVDSLPVDLISEKEFSDLTKGIKDAPKKEAPKPIVEKIDTPKPVEDVKPKVSDKPEIKATAEKPPEPQPPEKQEEKKAEQKPAEPPKQDAIADKLKKPEEKKLAKVEPVLPPKKPPLRPQPKFNPDKIAALLDKRDPQRNSITGAELNASPSLGTAMGNAAKLSQSELDALRARLMALWNPPIGIQNPEQMIIRIRIRLGHDGRLSSPPEVLSSGSGTVYNSARDSAVRAVFQGQPFDMLKPEHYDTWKDIEVTFDPKDMFGG